MHCVEYLTFIGTQWVAFKMYDVYTATLQKGPTFTITANRGVTITKYHREREALGCVMKISF